MTIGSASLACFVLLCLNISQHVDSFGVLQPFPYAGCTPRSTCGDWSGHAKHDRCDSGGTPLTMAKSKSSSSKKARGKKRKPKLSGGGERVVQGGVSGV
ncbi:unnamed protein product, partial [Sphacelaria rigidula]